MFLKHSQKTQYSFSVPILLSGLFFLKIKKFIPNCYQYAENKNFQIDSQSAYLVPTFIENTKYYLIILIAIWYYIKSLRNITFLEI